MIHYAALKIENIYLTELYKSNYIILLEILPSEYGFHSELFEDIIE